MASNSRRLAALAERVERIHQIKIILSTEEKGMLDKIRHTTGLTASDFLRQSIRSMVTKINRRRVAR